MNNNVTLLLTGCVNPNGMSGTSIQDAETRKKQYVDAIEFYLKKTSIKVVFVENSNFDLSDEFQSYINCGRLEIITFNGNNYNKLKGKGFGEACILIKALCSSTIIKKSKYVIKITGRIIVPNINTIIRQTKILCKGNCLLVDFYGQTFIPTMLFSFPPSHFKKYLQIHYNEIDDSKDFIFENMFYQYAKTNDLRVLPFICSPILNGVCGGTGLEYENRPFFKSIEGNFSGASVLYKIRGEKLKWFAFGVIYKISHVFCYNNHHIYNKFIINTNVH